ncbi:MAG TPA: helix-turn-helix domain-containing protein [Stellaceae bacterium]|jgi:transposase-like protein|nr:helix-turn-helix domain-containing protein [Stellaceae bacterium]
MQKGQIKTRDITAAQRGQIVQRVLVDGWSAAQAAATSGVSEREVARWVAAYRRYGMASLRNPSRVTRLADFIRVSGFMRVSGWAQHSCDEMIRMLELLRHELRSRTGVAALPKPRGSDDARHRR